MDKNSVNWKGYIPAITTPYYKNGEIDYSGWEKLLTWYMAEGMHGLLINARTGEWFNQTSEEKRKLYSTAAKIVKQKVPLIVGCTGYTPGDVIFQAKIAEAEKMDGILVSPPPYVGLNEKEIIHFYKKISDEVHLPICIYNFPKGINIDMNKDTIVALAKLDKVVAVKNSSSNLKEALSIFFATRETLRYFGFPLDELSLLLIKDYGLEGRMGAGGVLGEVHPNFFNKAWSKDYEAALYYGRKDQQLFQSWFQSDFSTKFGSAQAVIKAALNIKGLPGGYPRLPILPLSKENEEKIKEDLERIG